MPRVWPAEARGRGARLALRGFELKFKGLPAV